MHYPYNVNSIVKILLESSNSCDISLWINLKDGTPEFRGAMIVDMTKTILIRLPQWVRY